MTATPRPITIDLYTPHPGQRRIHKSKARFRIVACGRRYGKTFLGCNELIHFAATHANTLSAWVAPTYRQTKIAYRLIKKALHGLASYTSDTELRVELPNGAVMMFCSSDNYDSLRGNAIHFLVIDEAATVVEQAWTEVLRPCLSDTRGRALIIGTPKGRNWFYRAFNRGMNDDYPDWESFKAPTSENPYVPSEEVKAAKKELPEDVFAQEYDAAFLEESAGVFRGIDACTYGPLDAEFVADYWSNYVVGWDAAKYNDYSVVVVMDAKTRKVVAWDRFNQFDYSYQVDRVIGIAQRFNDAPILMDSTGVGDVILERLREKYHNSDGYLFTNASKKILIEKLQLGFQDRAISIPKIEVLINELRQFEYHLSPSRNVIYGAPDGEHDDCVIALALSYFLAQDTGLQPLDRETASAISQYRGY